MSTETWSEVSSAQLATVGSSVSSGIVIPNFPTRKYYAYIVAWPSSGQLSTGNEVTVQLQGKRGAGSWFPMQDVVLTADTAGLTTYQAIYPVSRPDVEQVRIKHVANTDTAPSALVTETVAGGTGVDEIQNLVFSDTGELGTFTLTITLSAVEYTTAAIDTAALYTQDDAAIKAAIDAAILPNGAASTVTVTFNAALDFDVNFDSNDLTEINHDLITVNLDNAATITIPTLIVQEGVEV